MTTLEIERRLRMAAPDEPAVLPPLLLPLGLEAGALGRPSVALRTGGGSAFAPRLAIAVLLLLGTLAGALAAGVLRLEQLTGPIPFPGLYSGRGFALDYPIGWTRLTQPDPVGNSGSSVALILSSHGVDGCEADAEAVLRDTPPPQPVPSGSEVELGSQQGTISGLADRQYACLIERPMAVGETRLVVAVGEPQRIAVGPFGDFAEGFSPGFLVDPAFEPTPERGYTETIGGMPARLVVRSTSVVPGADEVRTWVVIAPPATSSWPILVQAVLRGPDLDAMRQRADDVARSLRFDHLPPPLAENGRDAALATALDQMDREWRRWHGVRFLGCLPRSPGEQTATIADGPAGPLAVPLAVTCSTRVEAIVTRQWRATLTIDWGGRDGVPAGRWARAIWFDGNGVRSGEADLAPGTGQPMPFPGTDTTLPPPGEPPVFAPGTLVRILPPGASAGFLDVDTSRLPDEGQWLHGDYGYLVIVSGPATYDGRPWYVVDAGGGTAWVAASANGRPLLAATEPVCPVTLDALALAYLPELLRSRCAGASDLTLGPVQVGSLSMGFAGGELAGTPAWLARWPAIELYPAGVDGLDRGLPVVTARTLGAPPPHGAWVVVTGHFGDPAAVGCVWPYVDDRAPADVHERRCEAQFVVTAFTVVDAP